MKRSTQGLLAALTLAFAGHAAAGALPATTVTVLDTSLPMVSGTIGQGMATTIDLAGTSVGGSGRITHVSGPGGPTHRVSAPLATEQWQQRNVGGNGSVGITTEYARSGNGSITFLGAGSNDYKADLEYAFKSPVSLSSVTTVGYDWLRDSSSGAGANFHPSMRLFVKDGTMSGYLIYERIYNGIDTAAPTDTWITEDIGGAKFWASGNSLPNSVNSGQPITYDRTLADWANLLPNLQVLGLSTGIGSGWTGGNDFDGAVDNIVFGTTDGVTTWNFEVAPGAAVPLPGSLALLGMGGLLLAARRRRACRTQAIRAGRLTVPGLAGIACRPAPD